MRLKTSIPFTKLMYPFAITSLLAILGFASLVFMKVKTDTLNIGIDFLGGIELKIKINKDEEVSEGNLRPLLPSEIGVQKIIDAGQGGNVFLLRMKGSSEMKGDTKLYDNVMTSLRAHYGFNKIKLSEDSKINLKEVLPKTVKISEKDGAFVVEAQESSSFTLSDYTNYTAKIGSLRINYEETEFLDSPIVEVLNTSAISGVISASNMRNAALLILFSWLLILVYVAFRFEMRYAIGAIVALIHDAIIAFGFVVLFDYEINILVLSAILTLIGYSVNDTIVIFDRVRENLNLKEVSGFREVLNVSINQTLGRTLNTTVSTLLAVLAIFLFGGEVINGFAFTLLIGFIVGTYSTIFIASTVTLLWEDLLGKKKKTA